MKPETLKYFLLGSLLVMLAFVLYKRLIAALSKGKGRRNFLKVISAQMYPIKQEVEVKLEAQRDLEVQISLHDAAMAELFVKSAELEKGMQILVLNAQGYASATWVRIKSEFETVERRLEANN